MSYNLHSLIHFAYETFIHSSFYNFSGFELQSYLGKIKRLLWGTNLPLAQFKRRLSETNHVVS